MRMTRPLGLLAVTGLSLAALVAPVSTATAADAYTVTPLHFAVKVGPTDKTNATSSATFTCRPPRRPPTGSRRS